MWFWWGGNTCNEAHIFFGEWFCKSRGAVITMKDFSAFIDMRRYKTWAHKIGSWKYITIWRPVLPVFPLGTECLIFVLLSELLSGGVEIQQLQQHVAQSLQREMLSVRSVQFSCSVVSDSLWLHGIQHARLHYPTPALGACSIHVYRVSDVIQPSHPLSPTSPAFSFLSQHQGLFQWVSSSHQVAKVLDFQLQHQSFQWIFRTDLL